MTPLVALEWVFDLTLKPKENEAIVAQKILRLERKAREEQIKKAVWLRLPLLKEILYAWSQIFWDHWKLCTEVNHAASLFPSQILFLLFKQILTSV